MQIDAEGFLAQGRNPLTWQDIVYTPEFFTIVGIIVLVLTFVKAQSA